MSTTYFTPALFKFLNDLAANNDRKWFNANKDRYIETVHYCPERPLMTQSGHSLVA